MKENNMECFVVEEYKEFAIWYDPESEEFPYWTSDLEGSEIEQFRNIEEAKAEIDLEWRDY